LIYRGQLRRSAGSTPANIREAMGRSSVLDKNTFYGYARGSAEETDEHLEANFSDGHIAASVYWRLHNRSLVVVKMLDSLIKPG
jgi:four helix bundle protein